MKLQSVPARQGIVWVRRGFAAFFRQPIAFAAIFATFVLAISLLVLLQELGEFIAPALLPLVGLGFMLATRIAIAGGVPTPRVFFDALRGSREQVIAMIKLGVSFAIAAFVIMWLSDLIDGGTVEDLFDDLVAGKATPETAAARMAADHRIELGFLVRSLLASLLSVPFWHAPALVHWDGHGFAKSLFSSTIACWRNKGAFLMFSLTWFGVLMLTSFALNVVVLLLGNAQVAALLSAPAMLMLTTVFYVSLFFTFADCFADDTPDGEASTLT